MLLSEVRFNNSGFACKMSSVVLCAVVVADSEHRLLSFSPPQRVIKCNFT